MDMKHCKGNNVQGLHIVTNRRRAKRCDVDRAEKQNCGCMRGFVNTQELIEEGVNNIGK